MKMRIENKDLLIEATPSPIRELLPLFKKVQAATKNWYIY